MYRGGNNYADGSIRKKWYKSKDRERSCTEKIEYKAQTQVAQAAYNYNFNIVIRFSDVQPYKCIYCAHWHKGHDNRDWIRAKQERMREDESAILLLLTPPSNKRAVRKRTETLRHLRIGFGIAA